MNLTLQFHDSEVGRVEPVGDGLRVAFSAASVRQIGGGDQGHVLNLEMLLTDAAWSGTLADGVGRPSSGVLAIDGVPVSPLPLPFARDGKVVIALDFSNGSVLRVVAGSVRFRFMGEPRFVESFAC